jgi:glycosyltransferase involved in cell wall biosynthesis
MENYLRDAMVSLNAKGISNSALVHQSNIGLKNQDEIYPCGEQQLPICRAAVWARFLFTPISPGFPLLLNRLIKRQQPDLLHIHMPNASAFWALWVPRARKLPWVIHWHSDVEPSDHSLGLRLFYTLYSPFERAVLKRAKTIIATSPPYLDSSKPLQPFRQKCKVVPLGLNPAQFEKNAPDNTSHNGPQKPLQVLAIGRLTYYKGFQYLIKAAAQIENVEVHLVGTGDKEGELKSLAQSLTLEHKVHFHGSLGSEQLIQQLQACDCLCLPSIERTEAFGMVLLEAMACGKATVISDVPGSGMGWVVDNQQTGLLVPPQDSTALAKALKHLEQHRDKMANLGGSGYNKFQQEFHIDESTGKLAEIYQHLLNNT